jgi:hypothetical protein
MATFQERLAHISQLRQAHQEALDALLRMRLEGQNGLELGSAVERAQSAANMLFAARLEEEFSRPGASGRPGDEASQESAAEAV